MIATLTYIDSPPTAVIPELRQHHAAWVLWALGIVIAIYLLALCATSIFSPSLPYPGKLQPYQPEAPVYTPMLWR